MASFWRVAAFLPWEDDSEIVDWESGRVIHLENSGIESRVVFLESCLVCQFDCYVGSESEIAI